MDKPSLIEPSFADAIRAIEAATDLSPQTRSQWCSALRQIANALEEGATPEDILGVLRAVAPQVGGPRVMAAAPEIMLGLGLSLPEES